VLALGSIVKLRRFGRIEQPERYFINPGTMRPIEIIATLELAFLVKGRMVRIVRS
jgi:hypothetical protein